MRSSNENTPALLGEVNLLWYLVALVPIGALLYFGVTGVVSFYFAIMGIFAAFFWLFSLAFALYEKFVRRNKNIR